MPDVTLPTSLSSSQEALTVARRTRNVVANAAPRITYYLTCCGIGVLAMRTFALVPLVFISTILIEASLLQAKGSIGRPVRVVSLCFSPQPLFEPILKVVDAEGAKGADLICLPESCRGQNDQSPEAIDGPTVSALATLAKKHRTYILVPIDELQGGGHRRNAAILIDREGKTQGSYEKIFPYWSEYDHKIPVEPGSSAPVFETDFGKLGVAICFDANFPEVWQQLDDGGAELVIWSSAYSAGRHVGAYAMLHHYYIVTATWTGDCQVYDITGRQLLDEKSSPIHVTRTTLDLDRGIYHENFNLEKRDKLLKDHADKITQEDYLNREQWFVLKATQPGASARNLAHDYGLEELREYVTRSRRAINERRGHVFPIQANNHKQ
jgi:predicted amidohydrolase